MRSGKHRHAAGVPAIAALACAMLMPTLPAEAQAEKSDGAISWTFACGAQGTDAPLQCRMTQDFYIAEDKQKILSLTVAPSAREPFSPEMTLALPHGALLPPGLALKVDDQQPVIVPVEWSNAAGVYARVDLGGELGTALKRGSKLLIGVTNRSGGLVQIPVSLAGFSAAVNRLAALK